MAPRALLAMVGIFLVASGAATFRVLWNNRELRGELEAERTAHTAMKRMMLAQVASPAKDIVVDREREGASAMMPLGSSSSLAPGTKAAAKVYESRGAEGQGPAGRYDGYSEAARRVSPEDRARYGPSAMIVQFDTRRPVGAWPNATDRDGDRFLPPYYLGSAFLWAQYAARHSHQHAYYTRPDCSGCDGRPLRGAWCKIAAVLQAVRA